MWGARIVSVHWRYSAALYPVTSKHSFCVTRLSDNVILVAAELQGNDGWSGLWALPKSSVKPLAFNLRNKAPALRTGAPWGRSRLGQPRGTGEAGQAGFLEMVFLES